MGRQWTYDSDGDDSCCYLHWFVLDEAHYARNPKTTATGNRPNAVQSDAQYPIQNKAEDLMSSQNRVQIDGRTNKLAK